jgi:hypothetical protein
VDIGCIGFRHLPEEQLRICRAIGARLIERGHNLISGNAPGADQAFAMGANRIDPTRVWLKLPWPKFEQAAILTGNHVEVVRPTEELEALVRSHCYYDGKSQGSKKLLLRDGLITQSVDRLIAFPSPAGSGTQFTMKLAAALRVPVIDLSNTDHLKRLIETLRS